MDAQQSQLLKLTSKWQKKNARKKTEIQRGHLGSLAQFHEQLQTCASERETVPVKQHARPCWPTEVSEQP